MSQQPDTVLQVQCGSCLKIVNVPAAFLDQLLMYKMYNCPHCKSRQSINLDPQQETSLRFQARQILSQQAKQQQQQAHVAAAAAAALRQQQQQQAQAAAALQQHQQQQQQQQHQQQHQAAAQLAAYQQALLAAAGAGAGQRPASAPQAGSSTAAMLQALQQQLEQMSSTIAQQQQAQQAQQAAAAQRPASGGIPHSHSAAALQQLLQMQQQLQQHQAAAANAAAVTTGARPGALTASQSGAALAALAQMAAQQQQHGKPPLPGMAGLTHAQLAQFLPRTNEPSPDEEDDADDSEVRDTFMEYKPAKLSYGQPHPDAVVETASLAAVEPPDITYKLKAHKELVDCLSALQLESVVYACQRHQQMLPDGSRGGFFIGDGAGVGKGRTIAGLILENWRHGRRKHLWLSVGSDLKVDTKRDLDDVGASDLPVHALNKLPYGKLAGAKIGVKDGVIFSTYSSLISSSDSGRSRFKQLLEWCGKDFDGLIIFDESHKAKNLVPEAGTRATQVGLKVRELQLQLPKARVVYCSATGASEPRNMGYMVRLGLWGEGNPAFHDFGRFLEVVQGKSGPGGSSGNMAALELVAMDMKAQGMYVCRTLSFAGAEFETVEAPLEEPIASQYAQAAATWNLLFREFLYAEEQAAALEESRAPSATTDGAGGGRRRGGFGDSRSMTWRSFWAAHQAFFRHMTMAAKVPAVVRMAKAAVASGRCAVIGLQSTGEARTADVVAEKGEELDDFVSGPKELLIRLVDNYYPLPVDPNDEDADADTDSDEDYDVAAVTEAVARNALEGRDQVYRGAKARPIRYREFSESEEIGNSSSSEDEDDSSTSTSSASSSEDEEEGEGEEDKGKGKEQEKRRREKKGAITAAAATAAAGKGRGNSEGKQATSKSRGAAASKRSSGRADGSEMEEAPIRSQATRRRVQQARASGGGSKKKRSEASGSDGEDSSEDEEGSGSEGRARRSRRSTRGGGSGGGSRRKAGRSGSVGSEDSGDEYDPTMWRGGSSSSTSSSSSSSGSEGEEGRGSLTTQQREERREAKRLAAEVKRLQRERAEAAYAAALKRKEAVLAEVQKLELPMNPLDTLIDQLGGPVHVAEMTGRKGRLVRSKSSGGVVYEMRNASGVDKGATLEMINVHERELFLAGQKLVAIISEAASTGISLHADRRCANQRRRVHLTLELPWSADKAIQQFGRTHRANQAHGPQYRLIFTPLGGERRFAAAVARRLESLGALTQGDRRAGPSLSAFNYESVWGQRALRETYLAITGERRTPLALPQACRPGPAGEPPRVPLPAFLGRARALLLNVGIIRHNKNVVSASRINEYLGRPEGAPASVGRIDEKDMSDVPRFLNRLLGLEPVAQQALFDLYQVTLEALMERARREGALDEGIVDIKAHAVSLVGSPRVLHRDTVTGASTVMYEVELDRGLPWQDAAHLLEQQQQAQSLAAAGLTSPVCAAAVPAVLASVPAEGPEHTEEEDEQGAAGQAAKAAQDGEEEEEEEKQRAVEAGAAEVKDDASEEEQQGQQHKQEEQQGQQPQQRRGRRKRGAAVVKQEQQVEQPAAEVKQEEEEQQQQRQQGQASSESDQQPSSGAAAAAAAEQQQQQEDAAKRRSPRKANGVLAKADGAAVDEPQEEQQVAVPGKRRRQDESEAAQDGQAGSSKRSRAGGASALPAQQQQKAKSESMIDLTLSDSEEGAAAGGSPADKRQQQEQQQQVEAQQKPAAPAAAAADSDVIVVESSDEDGAAAARAGKGAALTLAGGKGKAERRWESGFYRAKQEGINRQVHVLLALRVEGSQPPIYNIYRPATGRSRQNMSLQELKARYSPLEPSACKSLWEKAYDAAGGGKDKDGKEKKVAVARKKRLHILGGAVMRSWGAVQAALARHVKPSERRMRVLRIATTGESSQRLVGMLVPEPAVEEVVETLQRQSDAGKVGAGEGGDGDASAAEEAPAAGAAAAGKKKTPARGGKQQQPATQQRGRKRGRAQEEEEEEEEGNSSGSSSSEDEETEDIGEEEEEEQPPGPTSRRKQPLRKPPPRGQPPQRRQPPRGQPPPPPPGKRKAAAAAEAEADGDSSGGGSSSGSDSVDGSSSSSDSDSPSSSEEEPVEAEEDETGTEDVEEEEEEEEEEEPPPKAPVSRRAQPTRGKGARTAAGKRG